jgi:hypothetical protein
MATNPLSADQNPDLSLAMIPNVASGSSVTYMPNYAPQGRGMPATLSPGDIEHMGIDPSIPFEDLNLAGRLPIGSPPYNAPSGDGINPPTHGMPDFSQSAIRPYNLSGDGIDFIPPFAPDPHAGDLLQFAHPHGLDITAATSNPMAIDPMTPDLSSYDNPSNLFMLNPLAPDPLLPDLQNPASDLEVDMPDRPGDLAEPALSDMHSDASYKAIPSKDYEELWMQQKGANSSRERHMGMLMRGLDREEGAR